MIILKVVRIFLKGVRIFLKTPKSHIVRIFVPPHFELPSDSKDFTGLLDPWFILRVGHGRVQNGGV